MPTEDKSTPEEAFYTPGKAPAPQPAKEEPIAEASEVEVLDKVENSGEITASSQSLPKRFAWLPWRRPNPRDHQIAQLRDGYIELVDLVRNINHHLDRQKTEASQVTGLVQSLPPVLASFEKLATSQEQGTAILGRIDTHMAAATKKDEKLMENMDGFNTTIKEVSETNRGAMGALERVQTKMETSEDRMSSLFDQANKNSETVGGMMMRLEKRLFLSNLALILLLAILIGLGIFWSTRFAVESTLDENQTATPVTQAAPLQPDEETAPEVAGNPAVRQGLPQDPGEVTPGGDSTPAEPAFLIESERPGTDSEPVTGATEMEQLIEELELLTGEIPDAAVEGGKAPEAAPDQATAEGEEAIETPAATGDSNATGATPDEAAGEPAN